MGFRRAAIMPLAETCGYVIAISFFVLCAGYVKGNQTAFIAMKIAAAAWLIYSAYRLWGAPFEFNPGIAKDLFAKVLLTTIVNPKAMLVGTVLIPSDASGGASLWIGTYAALSTIAGIGWVFLGSLLPIGIRQHAYRIASIVLSFFSIAAVASTFSA